MFSKKMIHTLIFLTSAIMISAPFIYRFILYPTTILYKPHAIESVMILFVGAFILLIQALWFLIKYLNSKQ